MNTNSIIDSSITTGILKIDVSDRSPVFLVNESSKIDLSKKDTFAIGRNLSSLT